MNKRLYKSRNNAKFDGVCAGIADYFNIDPTLVRLAWVVFSCMGGSGVLAYIICMIVMPREPVAPHNDPYDDPQRPNGY